ncbi:hypothetical protein MNBD_GAMMA11-1378 [hydrothermal vent metagenome]|uniref:DUF3379 domain-containing protein n=1 Tax=hydrothermal vent metagenome TaxID=652676 RepID=A0A3B0WR71_9ZZZZ
MDDLEFRRRAYAEPDSQDEDFLAYKNQTLENTRLIEELHSQDKSLKQAMQIAPPPDLAERIKLNQALGRHQTLRKRLQVSTFAASVLLVLGLVFSVMPPTSMSLQQQIGQVNYLGSCDIASKKGVHMVVQGDIGPITVFMLPGVSVDSQQLIKDERFHGMITPGSGGSVVVVGEKGESLRVLQDKLNQYLVWI